MRRCDLRGFAGLALLIGVLLAPGPATAQAKVDVRVTVVQASDGSGGIDPRARRFDEILRGQIAYQSLRVEETHQRKVGLDEVWDVPLPTSGRLRLRPLDVGAKGTLMSVDLENHMQGDFRVRAGKPLIVGGPRYESGKLVIVVESKPGG